MQVGDPFLEKLLLEACLELMSGDALVGIQDMGAAGLTSSSIEMAGRAGNGIALDLDAVPRRETGMSPYEIMLSESQERMVLVAKAGREHEVRAVCAKWDIDCAVIGKVTSSGHVVVTFEGKVVADLPVAPLVEGLKYERPIARPAWQDEVQILDGRYPSADVQKDLLTLLGAPQIASKEWVYRQYDFEVRDSTVVKPGGDAAVVRILDNTGAPSPSGGPGKAIALTTDCNHRFCFLDPYEGARLAVAEAFRNIAVTGGEPIAITDCLNFGNPERPEILWQLAECVRGLGDACRALGTPVVSGNVSLYNETDGQAIMPTPSVGMVGLLDDVTTALSSHFPGAGLRVALLGVCTGELGGSQYLATIHGKVKGAPPRLDVGRELAVGRACIAMAKARVLASAHDCAEGGLAVALTECCVMRAPSTVLGATIDVRAIVNELADHELLFAEAPSRIVISYAPEHAARVAAIAKEHGAPLAEIGTTGGPALIITNGKRAIVNQPVKDLAREWTTGFSRIVQR